MLRNKMTNISVIKCGPWKNCKYFCKNDSMTNSNEAKMQCVNFD